MKILKRILGYIVLIHVVPILLILFTPFIPKGELSFFDIISIGYLFDIIIALLISIGCLVSFLLLDE